MEKRFTKNNIIEHPEFVKLFKQTALVKYVFQELISAFNEDRTLYLDDLLESLKDKGFKLRWFSEIFTALKRSWGKDLLPIEVIKTDEGKIISIAPNISQGELARITQKIDLTKNEHDYIDWFKQLEIDYQKFSESDQKIFTDDEPIFFDIFLVRKLSEIQRKKPTYEKKF